MPTVAWLLIGLIAGLIATMVDRDRGPGAVVDVIVGILGAEVAEAVFRALRASGGVDYWGIAVAAGGAVVALAAVHAAARLRRWPR